jgi:hypothetical protein
MPDQAIQPRPLVEGNVMLPLEALPDAHGGGTLAYTTSTAQKERNAGHVCVHLYAPAISQQEPALRLTDQAGDYGPPVCARQGDTLWVAHTAYQDKHKSLWLHAVRNGHKVASRLVLGPAKVDHPHLALFEGELHVVWEDYGSGEAQIVHARFSPRALLAGEAAGRMAAEQAPAAVTEPKSYQPQLISDGRQLYLFYEWFCQGRYRLMARCLTEAGASFSEAFEIGFETRNDQAASLALQEGKVVVVWENSSPLDKGYEWVSPAGHKVVMPAFGHGWRVNTRMGLRRVYFEDQAWHLEDLLAAPGASIDAPEQFIGAPEQFIGAQEAAGAPRVQVVGETIYVSYLRWDYGSPTAQKGWEICTKLFDGERWIRLDPAGLFQKQRVRPAVWVDGAAQTLYTWGQSPELEKETWSDWTQENAATFAHRQPLPPRPYARPAAFVTARREQLVRPAAVAERRRDPYTVRFEDGERQLLWGDLHMHSNLSGCSLGARFHCTEVEEKFRFCRDVGGLDFALNTDHDSMRDHEWYRNRACAHLHDLPGHFIAFNGYEWTCSHFDERPNYGHYNILYQEDGPMLRTGDPNYQSIGQVAARLDPESALAIPHHPGDKAHPLDWNAYDPAFAPLVEIFQVRGSYEEDNGPMHPELYGRNTVRKHSLRYGLNRGYDFGFTSGGEHEGVGVTGVYAAEFTRQGIFEALRERRTFGTTGARIVVDFRLEGQPMGSRLTTAAPALTASLSVIGADVLTSVQVIQNGRICQEWRPDSLQFSHTWRQGRAADPSTGGSREYVYVVVTQCDAEMAWTSPIFVYEEEDH